MHIVKNLTFKVPNSVFHDRQGFTLLKIDTKDPNIRALLKWNPVTTKAEYKIKLINSTTKESYRHALIRTELIGNNQYILVFWNPHEGLDAIKDLLPTVTITGILAGILSKFSRVDKAEVLNKVIEKEKGV